MQTCRLCGKDVFRCGGWLERVNEKGVDGIFECRPSCNAKLSGDEAMLGAIAGQKDTSNPPADPPP